MSQNIYSFNTQDTPLLQEVGGKALSLINTKKKGLPVPNGIVLTVDFFEAWTKKIKASKDWKTLVKKITKTHCNSVKANAAKLTLSKKQIAYLKEALSDFNTTTTFAVRSSSPEEDLSHSSFAGMYKTFLGVTQEQLNTTIAQAYSSMFDFRVMAYKTKNNIDIAHTCISIIIQEQISSDVSGVGFSLNPLNNCYDEAVINASFGLGEAIVSGIVTPDTYIVEKHTNTILDLDIAEKKISLHLKNNGGIVQKNNENPLSQTLTKEQILALTSLIIQTEEYYGFPVDIEWAYAQGHLYLLQARPITTYIPLFPEMLTKPGERKKLYLDLIALTQGFDDALSVLGADIWRLVLDYIKMGSLPEGDDGYVINIAGRQYFLLHNIFKGLGKKAAAQVSVAYDNSFEGREEEIYNEYKVHKTTPLMKQGRKALIGVAKHTLLVVISSMFNHKNEVKKTHILTKRLMSQFKNIQNDKAFDKLVLQCFETFKQITIRTIVVLPALLAQSKIKKMMKGTKGEALLDSIVMDVPSNPTSAMGKAMFKLASFQEIQDTKSAKEFEKKIINRTYSQEFMDAFDVYHYAYGERGFKEIDIASKRLSENLSQFFIQLKNLNLEDSQILKATNKKQEALKIMRNIAKSKRKLSAFNKAIDTIDLAFGIRETPKYLIVVLIGNLRKTALAIGEKFVTEKRLENKEQIFDLNITQITQAQQDTTLDLALMIEANLKPYQIMNCVKRFPNHIDSRGRIFHRVVKAEDGDFVGMSVSNGVIRGKAKVLLSPYEKPLESGEILVTVATEPSWTPIFSNASGVVLETGGGLQHGAIIAREYGLPCVSSLVGITNIIKDGDMLEVDGNNGIVKILSSKE